MSEDKEKLSALLDDGLHASEIDTSEIEKHGYRGAQIANEDGIGFAKDRFAMKPLVVVRENGELAAATEEQAVRRINADECEVINYDGPSLTELWAVGNRKMAA